MVDRGGLENRCGLLGHRGFESLSLRKKKNAVHIDSQTAFLIYYNSFYKSSCFVTTIPSRMISKAIVWLQRPRL